MERFESAIQQIDEANGSDPRNEMVEGRAVARELHFSQKVYEWIEKLVAAPSEELLLATRGHTLRRWEVPRDRYTKDNIGYHEWRDACAKHHAEHARLILERVGYADEKIRRVETLILRGAWPHDPEARALEDADCLAFLETKLHQYLEQWDEEKTLRILRGTFNKMSAEAREQIPNLKLSERAQELLGRLAG